MRCEIPPWSPLQPQHPAQTQQHIITALPCGMSCSEKGGGTPRAPQAAQPQGSLHLCPPWASSGIPGFTNCSYYQQLVAGEDCNSKHLTTVSRIPLQHPESSSPARAD